MALTGSLRRNRHKAAIEGRWQTTMRFWNRPQLLVIDELGYLPMPGEAANHLFQVISRRYEHGSIILTTNPRHRLLGEIFEDTTVAAAILDRRLHHAGRPAHRRRIGMGQGRPRSHGRARTVSRLRPPDWPWPSRCLC